MTDTMMESALPGSKSGKAGYLYRYWSDRGTLLYIGISINAVARLGQHRDQAWFPRIARIDVQRFDTYEEAECAELKAICYEGPIHNVKGPRDTKEVGPALSRLRAAQRRRANKVPPKHRKMKAAYDIDLLFKCIPEGTAFETYRASDHMHGDEPGW